jgi:hypothetical protein
VNALVSQRISAHAAKLGLPELAENITERAARAEQAQLGYLDFVDQLLEDEVGAKESRRFRNALRLSGLPHNRGLDEFDFAFQPAWTPAKSATSLDWGSSAPSPISRCSAHRASARPCSPSVSRSQPAKRATRFTSPPWTTSSANSAPPSRRPLPPTTAHLPPALGSRDALIKGPCRA